MKQLAATFQAEQERAKGLQALLDDVIAKMAAAVADVESKEATIGSQNRQLEVGSCWAVGLPCTCRIEALTHMLQVTHHCTPVCIYCFACRTLCSQCRWFSAAHAQQTKSAGGSKDRCQVQAAYCRPRSHLLYGVSPAGGRQRAAERADRAE